MQNELTVKNWIYNSVFFLALVALSVSGSAQQPSAGEKPVTEKKATRESGTTEPTPVKPGRQEVEPAGHFNPSEKLRADDAVSFPVDI
jgi:hypothetical protein